MSQRLRIDDVVLVRMSKTNQAIGLIKYIGPMVDMMSEYAGIELLESITDGHDGTVNSFTYFTAPNGHGYHTKITNIIQKLAVTDLFTHLKKTYALIKKLKKVMKKETPPRINTALPRLLSQSGIHYLTCAYNAN